MLIARSVFREVARNFLAALAATTGAAFFMLCITFLKRTPGVGLGFLVDVFPLFFPLALQFTVPLSVLTGVVMTFNRMTADGEVIALQASGISLGAIARPILAGAMALSLVAFLLLDLSAPFAAEKLRGAQRDLVHQLQTSFRAGLCDLDLGRGRISFENYTGGVASDICLEWRRSRKEVELWRAQQGSISVTPDDNVVVALHNAVQVLPRHTSRGDIALSVKDVVLERSLDDIVGEGGRRRKQTGMSLRELAYIAARKIAPHSGGRVDSIRAMEEIARRTALAASAFFFALAGIPLGILSGRGGKVGAILMGISPVLAIYFPLVIAGSNLARRGKVPAIPALWAGNAVFLVLALWLFRRAARR